MSHDNGHGEGIKPSGFIEGMGDFLPNVKSIPDINCQGYDECGSDSYGRTKLFLFSGSSDDNLMENLAAFLDTLKASPHALWGDVRLPDIRKEEVYRYAVLADSKDLLASYLEEAIKDPYPYPKVSRKPNQQLAFLITCQGSQYPKMGSRLYNTSPYFRKEFDECATLIESEYPGMCRFKHFIKEGCDKDIDWTTDPKIFLPYLLTMNYALFELFTEKWGVVPTHVVGLSFGDYVSALISGILTLKDTVNLVMTRLDLMTKHIKEEAFLVVEADMDGYQKLVEEFKRAKEGMEDFYAEIGARNSPKQTCIVGTEEHLQSFYDFCKSKGLKVFLKLRNLPYHSTMAAPILPEFEKVTTTVNYGTTDKIQFISNVDGEVKKTLDKDYFLKHLTGPMNLIDSILTLAKEEGVTHFIEIGPHPLKGAFVKETIHHYMGNHQSLEEYAVMGSLHKKVDDRVALLNLAGKLFLLGYNLDWGNVWNELLN